TSAASVKIIVGGGVAVVTNMPPYSANSRRSTGDVKLAAIVFNRAVIDSSLPFSPGDRFLALPIAQTGFGQDVRRNGQSFQRPRLDLDRARPVRLADPAQVGRGVGMIERRPEFVDINRKLGPRIDAEEPRQRDDFSGVANEAGIAPPQVREQEGRRG